MDDQNARVAELREQRDAATRRITELEQERREAAADQAAYHAAGEGIARQRAELERLATLLQTAEAELHEQQLAAQRVELESA